MSRAFVREDVSPPEPEPVGAFRVLWSVSLASREREIVHSGDDLLEIMRWARTQRRGFYEVRDAKNTVLAEIG